MHRANIQEAMAPRGWKWVRKPTPTECFRAWVCSCYAQFYQLIYGPGLQFTPPAELLSYLEPLEITSARQLEALFALWNAAQRRSPFEDVRYQLNHGRGGL